MTANAQRPLALFVATAVTTALWAATLALPQPANGSNPVTVVAGPAHIELA